MQTVSVVRGYWQWLGTVLGLTRGGRVAFTAVAAIVLGVSVLGIVLADPNDQHADQSGGVFLVFGGMLLGIVVGLDAAFRLVRGLVRPTPPRPFVRSRFDSKTGRPIVGYDAQTGKPILGDRLE
jgi:hypothetical protein